MSIYESHGYKSRAHWLIYLSEAHRIPFKTVEKLSHILGADRDFNGLEDVLIVLHDEIKRNVNLVSRW